MSNKTIYKYEIEAPNGNVVLPETAEILCVHEQHGKAYVWALVDPTEIDNTTRRFKAYGTGHTMPNNPGTYVGSFFLHKGSFVFHLFEQSKA